MEHILPVLWKNIKVSVVAYDHARLLAALEPCALGEAVKRAIADRLAKIKRKQPKPNQT